MPSTRSIRERDEPLPSLLAQWRTPSASRATATRSASYNQAVVSSPATASTAGRSTSTTATATTRAAPDDFGPTRSRSSTATTRAPSQQPTSSSTANSTLADSDSESDSSASSLEGLAKRLTTARQAKSKSRRSDTGATAAEAGIDKAPVRRRKGIEGHEKDRAETASDRSASIDDGRRGGSASRSRATRSSRPSGTSSPSSLAQRSRPVSPSTTTTDRAPADFDSGPTLNPGAAPDGPDRRGDDDDDDESGMASSNNEDDEDEEEGDTSAAYVVSHAEGHPDPRDLLRAQLARPLTARSTSRPSLRSNRTDSRTESLSAGRTAHSQGSKPTDKADSTVLDNDKADSDALLYLPRRYFILSTAGKLVYTSDPSEEAATGLVGVMQAIVSIFADEGDKIRYIDAGQTRISFLLKAPLYLVVVSSQGEPEPVLRQHLEYLYLQVLSVVTLAQLQSIFAKRSNFDLRQLIAGTEPFFDSITSSLQTSFAILFSSISVYRLSPSLRSQLARALDPGKEAIRDLDLLYVLLLAEGRLVTLLRPKKHSIHPTDLHLLLSTIYAPRRRGSRSEEEEAESDEQQQQQQRSSAAAAKSAPDEKRQSRRSRPSPLVEPGAEAWLPICLPRFNSRGFLHAYVSFLETGSAPSKSNGGDAADEFVKVEGDEAGGGGGGGVGLVILSSRRDAFASVQSTAQAIKHRLLSSSASTTSSSLQAPPPNATTSAVEAAPDGGLVHSILMARAHQSYSLGEVAVPGLRHFVYKDRERVQVTMPRWEGEYDVEEHGAEAERARMRLMTLYQRLHQSLHAMSSSSSSAQHRGDRETGAPSSSAAAPSVQYLRTSREAVLGWVTTDFELYVSTSPLLPHAAVVSCARSVSKWVKQDSARLFLSGKGAGVF